MKGLCRRCYTSNVGLSIRDGVGICARCQDRYYDDER